MKDYGLLIQKKVQKSWLKLTGLVVACNYYVYSNGGNTYDATTGVVTKDIEDPVEADFIFDDYDLEKYGYFPSVKEGIQKNTKIALTPYLDLPITITINDRLVEIVSGNIWEVRGFKLDPAKAVYNILVVKINGD